MRCLPFWNTSLGGGAAGDARVAARAERLDERTLGRGRLAPIGPQQVDRPAHRLRALHLELDELAATQLVVDDELGDEADPEPGGDRALDRLVGVQLPALAGLV